ncbi:hypothetical protein ACWGDE_29345 [Streptomyces sp. NPDC054956]
MSRRLPPPLRTWSGALLVCALLLCLTGLARPAMARAMAMPGSMDMGMDMDMGVTAAGGHSAGPAARGTGAVEPAAVGTAVEDAAAVGTAGHSTDCPTPTEHCATARAVLAQGGPAGPAPLLALLVTDRAAPAPPDAEPNAPPGTADPPDLHRLCVSRT